MSFPNRTALLARMAAIVAGGIWGCDRDPAGFVRTPTSVAALALETAEEILNQLDARYVDVPDEDAS